MNLKLFGRQVREGAVSNILSLFPLDVDFGRLAGGIVASGGHCLELMTYGAHELELRKRCAVGTPTQLQRYHGVQKTACIIGAIYIV